MKPFACEESMIVGKDAAFANDAIWTSQSEWAHLRQGNLLLFDWRSTCVRRVCRSMLQAETMPLISGMEECEHLKFLVWLVA